MADEIVYKKVTRKADKGLEGKVIAKHGKQTNQKLKPYVVLEYLMKYSDENNTKSAYDISHFLQFQFLEGVVGDVVLLCRPCK